MCKQLLPLKRSLASNHLFRQSTLKMRYAARHAFHCHNFFQDLGSMLIRAPFEQQVAPGGTITGTGAPFTSTGYTNYAEPEEEEPEPIR